MDKFEEFTKRPMLPKSPLNKLSSSIRPNSLQKEDSKRDVMKGLVRKKTIKSSLSSKFRTKKPSEIKQEDETNTQSKTQLQEPPMISPEYENCKAKMKNKYEYEIPDFGFQDNSLLEEIGGMNEAI